MANEITLRAQLFLTKGSLSVKKDSGVLSQTHYSDVPFFVNETGSANALTTQNLTTGTIYNPGLCWVQNHGGEQGTQFSSPLHIGIVVATVFYPVIMIEPGEAALFRVDPSAALKVKSDDGECFYEVLLMEDEELDYDDGAQVESEDDFESSVSSTDDGSSSSVSSSSFSPGHQSDSSESSSSWST